MSVDYNAMSDQELKRYMLDHRDDEKVFYAYLDDDTLDRRKSSSQPRKPNYPLMSTVSFGMKGCDRILVTS